MAPNEPSRDDEMDLINAEFESMVSGLNLDQSSPRTYLDDLDELEREEADELNRINRLDQSEKTSYKNIVQAIKRWWHREGRDESDGAQL
jgi:hypothetical protein